MAALALGAVALTAVSHLVLPEGVRRWDGEIQPWGRPVTLAALIDHVLMLGNYSCIWLGRSLTRRPILVRPEIAG